MSEPPSPPNSEFTEEQKRYWDEEEHLARRDPRHPIIRTFVEHKLAAILRQITLPENPSILDVGAGNGYVSYYWQSVGRTVATDYSDVMLKNNPVQEKQVMDARAMDFADDSFDISFCMALLHHIEKRDRPKVIQEMARVSKRYVILIEPNSLNPLVAAFSLLKKEERGGLDFSLRTTKKLLTDEGLSIVFARSWGLLTPNRMPLSGPLLPLFRLLERPLPFGTVNIVIAEKERSA